MNVVLQSLVSNPMMSSYFLSDAHNRSNCALSKSTRLCLGCETDNLVESMFNGDRIPFSPHRYLLTTWRCTDHLAGYEQQDAHDFYISTMNAIHTHIGEALIMDQEERLQQSMGGMQQIPPSSQPSGELGISAITVDALEGMELYTEDSFTDEKCICVTHKVFAGFLRSDVQCLSCHSISTVKEAFLDISLDLESLSSSNQAPLTLKDVLGRFVQSETLDSFTCDSCREKTMCTKQLSIDQLPLTLCFHMKRFKHTLTSTRKIETYMPFPMNIDMTPYTHHSASTTSSTTSTPPSEMENGWKPAAPATSHQSIHSDNHQPNTLNEDPGKSRKLIHCPDINTIGEGHRGNVPRADTAIYSLYAVVNHSGNMENGHYTCFVRQGQAWFKCDDHTISKATKKEVLASKAYLLFYCRTVLEYQEQI